MACVNCAKPLSLMPTNARTNVRLPVQCRFEVENEKQFLSGSAGAGFGEFTGRHKLILALFFLAFVVMVEGVSPWEDLGMPIPTWWWWFPERAGTAC